MEGGVTSIKKKLVGSERKGAEHLERMGDGREKEATKTKTGMEG